MNRNLNIVGVSGKTLEELIKVYPATAVIELALNEIGNELFGGMASAGSKRLEAAGEKGIPQIITTGCIDIIKFLSPGTVPKSYRNRSLCYHNPQATLPRLNADELSQIAETVASKVNRSRGNVKFLIPLEVFLALDKQGMIFHDPEADKVFINTLRSSVDAGIEIEEICAHINDDAFADAVTHEFMGIVGCASI